MDAIERKAFEDWARNNAFCVTSRIENGVKIYVESATRFVLQGFRAGYAANAKPAAIQQDAMTASPAQGDAGQWQAPREGILHHALREQMARDAAEGLKAIEEQQAKRERRLAEEQRRVDDRRGNSCPCAPCGDGFGSICPDPTTGKPLCA